MHEDNWSRDTVKQPDACVVRIADAGGKTLGTGFLISADGQIATCAHVVEGTEAYVAFSGSKPMSAQVVSVHEAYDVAFLQLTTPLPAGVTPAGFAPSLRREGAAVRSFGYPKVGGIGGLWGVGQLIGYVTESGRPLLQLSSTQITAGFSGGPVWDTATGRVIGMVVEIAPSDRYGRLEDVAFAIPAETIRDLCPEEIILHHGLPVGVPFQVPPLPRYFVPRPEVSSELKAHLLADEAAAPGALVVSAVHGLGGIGKTTMVAALTHDPDLQARFPDGILWVTLGHQPEVLSLLVGWIQALHDYDFRPTVVESASNHLRTLLHDKACLLVVDDAWEADHLRPFLMSGDRCQVLVTTRDATLARKVGARLYDLDVMTESQALALFEARLGHLHGDLEQATALAHELGYLPLALELAAAQIEGGVSWGELLAVFRQELADLKALDLDEATYRDESLRISFRLSLERLPSEDREAFAWLGVLAEDAHLNSVMAATLWEQPEADARKCLRRLRDKALLRFADRDQYTIHDLLHDEAKLQLTEQMPLREAHSALLRRYRDRIHDGLWHTLPDDDYLHEHLTWHMEQAGQIDAIHTLLGEESADGRNGWYQSRERLGQAAGFLDDIVRAWRLAEEQFSLGPAPSTVGLLCRYALSIASLNSLAQELTPELLAALVKEAVWSPTQGLAYARRMPSFGQRVEAMARLIPQLGQPLREEVLRETLTAAKTIRDEYARAESLTELIPFLTGPIRQDAVSEAYAAAKAAVEMDGSTQPLSELTPHLPASTRDQLLSDVLAEVRAAEEWGAQTDALLKLAQYLPETVTAEVLPQALATARAIADVGDRARELAGLAPRLSDLLQQEVLHEALIAALDTEDEWKQARALGKLAAHLCESQLEQALAAAQKMKWRPAWAEALTGLIPYLPDSLKEKSIEEVLTVVMTTTNDAFRVEPARQTTVELSQSVGRERSEAMDDVFRWFAAQRWRASALIGLAPYLAPAQLQKAPGAAKQIDDKGTRVEALVGLVPYLPKPAAQEALQAALSASREIGDAARQAWALSGLAGSVPQPEQEQVLQEVLPAVQTIRNDDWRREALAWLAPHLPQPLRNEIESALLSKAERIAGKLGCTQALAESIPRLLGQDCQQAIALDRAHGSDGSRAWVIVELAPHVPETMLSDLLQQACSIENERARVYGLVGLAPHLPEALVLEALAAVRSIRDPAIKAWALLGLSSCLPEARRSAALQDALAQGRAVEDDYQRAQTLAGLGRFLPKHLVTEAYEEALAAAQKVGWPVLRVQVTARLSPHLSEPLRSQVQHEGLATAKAIVDPSDRAEALIALAPHLPDFQREEVLRDALAAAQAVDEEDFRVEALSKLSAQVATAPPDVRWPFLIGIFHALASCTRDGLLKGILALRSVILDIGGPLAILEVYRAIQGVCRWWP